MTDSTQIFTLDDFTIVEVDSFDITALETETFEDTTGSWRNSMLPIDSSYIYAVNEAGKVNWLSDIPAIQLAARQTKSQIDVPPLTLLSQSFPVDSGQQYNLYARITQHSDSIKRGACFILNKDTIDARGLDAIGYAYTGIFHYSDTSYSLPFTANHTGEIVVTFLQFNNRRGTMTIDSISLTKEVRDTIWHEPFYTNVDGWRNHILFTQDTAAMQVGIVEYDGSGQRLKVTQGDFKLPTDPPYFLDTWGGAAAINLQVEAGKRYRIKAELINPENIDLEQAFAGITIKNTEDLRQNGLFASADGFQQNIAQEGNIITGVFNAGNDTTLTALFFVASMKNIQEAARYYYLDNIVLEEVSVVKCGEEGTEAVAMNNGKYRFGFNGMEKDDEVHGTGNWLQFGDFGYDPRTVRRNNPDPVVRPWMSQYLTFDNNPILNADPSGLDWFGSDDGKTAIHRNSSDATYTTEDGSELKNIGTTHVSSNTVGNTTVNNYYYQDELIHTENIDNSGIGVYLKDKTTQAMSNDANGEFIDGVDNLTGFALLNVKPNLTKAEDLLKWNKIGSKLKPLDYYYRLPGTNGVSIPVKPTRFIPLAKNLNRLGKTAGYFSLIVDGYKVSKGGSTGEEKLDLAVDFTMFIPGGGVVIGPMYWLNKQTTKGLMYYQYGTTDPRPSQILNLIDSPIKTNTNFSPEGNSKTITQ